MRSLIQSLCYYYNNNNNMIVCMIKISFYLEGGDMEGIFFLGEVYCFVPIKDKGSTKYVIMSC